MMITKEQILEILDDTIEAENDNFAGLPSSPTIEGKNEAAEKLVKLFALHSVSVNEVQLCEKNYVLGFGNCLDCELANKCKDRKEY